MTGHLVAQTTNNIIYTLHYAHNSPTQVLRHDVAAEKHLQVVLRAELMGHLRHLLITTASWSRHRLQVTGMGELLTASCSRDTSVSTRASVLPRSPSTR